MRDILGELHDSFLSDPDPVRRAQIQMRAPLPKRFYEKVEVARSDAGFEIRLDGKPVRTPGKALLALPSASAARLVADEFSAQAERIDPITMPVTRLVNTAVDGVAADPQAVLDDIVRFSASDLVCYRTDAPQALVEREAAAWDPVLAWARSTLGARFFLAEGVMHVEQPPAAIAAVRAHLEQPRTPFALAALHVMTTLTGSALIALAVEAGALTVEEAWTAAHVDEDFQAEQWGADAEAAARRALRHRDMAAAAGLIAALAAD